MQLNKVMNKNLLFNYFYSVGKTIDTENLVCVTSRSPLYYVSAAYWDRDTFYWTYPGLLLCDTEIAREALNYFFKYQIKNVGTHSRYINGVVLEPGFELDELCAPIIGIDYYLKFTKDYDFVKQDHILNGIEKIIKLIMSKKNKNHFLFETFLLPTDDFRKYPYVTYNNALVWKVFKIMEQICDHYGYYNNAEKFKFFRRHIIFNNISPAQIFAIIVNCNIAFKDSLNFKFLKCRIPPLSEFIDHSLEKLRKNNEFSIMTPLKRKVPMKE